MFASAWRSFLMTSQSKKLIANEDVVAIVDDVINAVDFLVFSNFSLKFFRWNSFLCLQLDNVKEDEKEMITLLNVLTSLLIDLIYKNLSVLDAEQSFIKYQILFFMSWSSISSLGLLDVWRNHVIRVHICLNFATIYLQLPLSSFLLLKVS